MATLAHDLFSAHTRGQIVRALAKSGEWHGRRRGVLMRFELSNQPTLDQSRIEWHASVQRKRFAGISGTVFDALQEIERAVVRRK